MIHRENVLSLNAGFILACHLLLSGKRFVVTASNYKWQQQSGMLFSGSYTTLKPMLPHFHCCLFLFAQGIAPSVNCYKQHHSRLESPVHVICQFGQSLINLSTCHWLWVVFLGRVHTELNVTIRAANQEVAS